MAAEEVVEEKSKSRRKRRGETKEEQDELVQDESEQKGVTAPKGRATPSRRQQEEVVQRGNFITRTFWDIREYFRGVQDELDKVVWPTRSELIRLTRIVLAVMIASALILGLISFLFTELFILGFDNEIVFFIFFLAVGAAAFAYYRFLARRSDTKPY